MPQASSEDREWAEQKFGSIDNYTIEKWLVEQGFTLNRDWTWVPPRPYPQLTQDEKRAIVFLIDEWDYGGLNYERVEPVRREAHRSTDDARSISQEYASRSVANT